MKKALLAVGLVVVLAAGAVAAEKASDEAAIRKQGEEFAAAWNKNDYKTIASKFTADGDLINPMGRVAKGASEIEKLFQDEQTSVMKGTTFTRTSRSLQWVGPQVAVETWDATVTGMHSPDGKDLPPLKHIVTIVWVQKDGKWLAAVARPMAPVPPPPSSGAAPAK